MGLRDDILDMVAEHSGTRLQGVEESDLFGASRLEGDDADEFLDAFAERYDVDLSGFRDYFHYNGNEPPTMWRPAFPIDPSGKVMPYMPVSVDQFVHAAETGKWMMEYPPHRIGHSIVPKVMLVSMVFLLLVLIWLVFWKGERW